MSAICDECGKDIGWGSNIPGTVTLCPLCNCNHVVYSKTPEQRIADLEAQLAEANEAARLQRAIDKLLAWDDHAEVTIIATNFTCYADVEIGDFDCRYEHDSYAYMAAEGAAEAAAQWAEAQKGEADE